MRINRKQVPWHRVLSLAALCTILLAVEGQSANRGNGKIAFTSDRDGNREIYAMNQDGTNPTRLTNNSGSDDYPAWSPDGKRLAYLSQNASGGHSIKLMNPDGTGQTELTTAVYSENTFLYNWVPRWRMSWSPDGTRIAFCDGHDIYAINVDGTNRINLSNHPAFDSHPSWSPDGSRIIFSTVRF